MKILGKVNKIKLTSLASVSQFIENFYKINE